VYGASVSKDTISRITDKVIEDMTTWSSRPLQHVYAAIFIDAIYVKVRDGQVGNQPFYAAIGVDLAGKRDVLGLERVPGAGGEVGQALPSDPQALAQRLGAVHPLPGLRRGDPHGPMLHERDRYLEPASGCR
jgi:hypothetical protein